MPSLPEAKPENLWMKFEDKPTCRVPITAVGAFEPAETSYALEKVQSVRPVNDEEVIRHRDHLSRYGYATALSVLLCTPGPGSFEYGIADGQHRIAALKQLYEDPSLPRGVAYENLVRDGDDGVPHVPAVILENADPAEVIMFEYAHNNAMYQFSNGQGPFRLMEAISKLVDWNEYKNYTMYGLVETGVHARLQMSKMKTVLSALSLEAIKNYYYVITRAYHFDLLHPLLYEIRDPY
ncbi:hypothetical protein AC1031_014526 [Aphanomyces cochlioides]|nr:hypothetical protein AC1031_014526 [Aphanomyces cochlioides]